MPDAAVPAHLRSRLQELAPVVAATWPADSPARGDIRLSLLSQNTLPDSSTVLLARDAEGRAGAVVLVSARGFPNGVQEAGARARSAAADLGEDLGRKVVLPRSEGRLSGLSYAVLPYCSPLRTWPVVGRLQRRLLLPAVLDWLRGVAGHCRMPAPASETRGRLDGLRAFAATHQLDPVGHLARHAAARLASSAWRPVHVAMHADLWSGNILIAPPQAGVSWAQRFVMVDWGAYSRRGHGVFDLLRAARSLQCPPSLLRRELLAHCRLLECDVQDSISHLAGALARIATSIGHFPAPRFGSMANDCIETLEAALPELKKALRPAQAPLRPLHAADSGLRATEKQ